VVIESFGIGNIPTDGPFFEWASQNSKLPEEERKILINISQVFQSVIKNIYETGQMAFDLGMIPGSDMTCEAAVSKLSYLVAKGYRTFAELNKMMTLNLRGELTEEEDRLAKQSQNYTLNSMTVLDRHFKSRAHREK
jgi:lysophospholipase